MLSSKRLACPEELENDPDRKFLQKLENGAAVEYKSDLGNNPGVFHGE